MLFHNEPKKFKGCVILLLLSSAYCQQVKPQPVFKQKPVNITIQEEESFLIPCRINGWVGLVQWSQDTMILGGYKNLVGYPRYSINIDKDEGVYDLVIENATKTDTGQYDCQVSGQGIKIMQRSTFVNVLPRTKPMLILGPSTLIAGRHSSFNCSVQSPSFQDAKFDWIVSQKVVKIESSKTSSVITIEATEGKMSENIQCKAWNKKNETIRDTKCLEIQFPPGRVDLLYEEFKDILSFSCNSSASYPKSKITWYVNGDDTEALEAKTRDLENEKGFATRSELKVVASPNVSELKVCCNVFWLDTKVNETCYPHKVKHAADSKLMMIGDNGLRIFRDTEVGSDETEAGFKNATGNGKDEVREESWEVDTGDKKSRQDAGSEGDQDEPESGNQEESKEIQIDSDAILSEDQTLEAKPIESKESQDDVTDHPLHTAELIWLFIISLVAIIIIIALVISFGVLNQRKSMNISHVTDV